MQEREEFEGVFEDLKQVQKISKYKYYFFSGLACLSIGVYLLFLIFGTNSWSVLLLLREKKNYLKQEIESLQSKNVELQKINFELGGLEPTNEE